MEGELTTRRAAVGQLPRAPCVTCGVAARQQTGVRGREEITPVVCLQSGTMYSVRWVRRPFRVTFVLVCATVTRRMLKGYRCARGRREGARGLYAWACVCLQVGGVANITGRRASVDFL